MERRYIDGIAHVLAGAAVAALCVHATEVLVAGSIGMAREGYQMLIAGDRTWGHRRTLEVGQWVLGGALVAWIL